MTAYEIKHCDFQYFEEHFLDDLYEDYAFLTQDKNGHAKEFHCNKSDMDLLLRSIKENKDEISAFVSEEDMINGIQDVLDRRISDVYDWLQSSKRDFKNQKDYKFLKLNLNLGGKDPIGYGFKVTDSKYDKYSTTGINVILLRDEENYSPYGFFVETAYPDLTIGHKTNELYTGRWLVEHLKGELTLMEKMSLYVKDKYPELSCYTGYKDNERYVSVKDDKNIMYMRDYRIDIKIRENGEIDKKFDDISAQYNIFQKEHIKMAEHNKDSKNKDLTDHGR